MEGGRLIGGCLIEVRLYYVLGLQILTFEGKFSYVSGLVILTFGG